jgi:hypothetical protein
MPPRDVGTGQEAMIHSNFSGLWQANLGRSRIAGPAPSKIVMKIAHSEDALTQEIEVTHQNGEQNRQAVSFSMTEAESTTELRGVPLRICVRWNGPEMVIQSTYSGNVFRDYWSLSDDGQVLTMEHRDDAIAGQVTVLERVM